MPTETWRGGVLYPSRYRYRTRYNNGTPTAWTDTANYTATDGSSRTVTSKRGRDNMLLVGRKAVGSAQHRRYKPIYRQLSGHKQMPNGFFNAKRIAEETGASGKTEWLRFNAGNSYYAQWDGPFMGCLTGIADYNSVDTSAYEKSVDSRLFQSASAVDFEGVTQLGEALETLAMLRSPLSTLREAGTSLYRKFEKNTSKLTGTDLQEAISGTWLEYSFGVAPLIFGTAEIVGDLVAVFDPQASHLAKKISVGVIQTVEELSETKTATLWPSTYGCVLHYRKETVTQLRVRGGMWIGIDPRQMSASARMGFTSLQAIVAQYYALMPLSFAVDWMVGIGPLLQECCPIRGKTLSSWRSTSVERVVTAHALKVSRLSSVAGATGSCKSIASQLSRVVNVQPPGALQLGPGLFSLSQGLSAAALAAGPLNSLWRKLPWH